MIRPVALALPLTPVVAGAAVAAPTLPRVPRGLPKPFEITVDVTLTRTTTWDARRGSAGDVCGSYRKASGRQVVVVGMRSADGTANVVRSRLSRPYLLVQARGDRANVNVNRTWDVIQAPCTSPPPAPPREADDCGRRRSATPSVRLTWTTGTDAEVVSPVPDRLLIVGLPVPVSRRCEVLDRQGRVDTTFRVPFAAGRMPEPGKTTTVTLDRSLPCELATGTCTIREEIRVEVLRDRSSR